ncbi:MAG TPA: hypothetical protein VE866_16110, partial [Candidatus Binatia bacterium]|nr:hypothetical protein [Candidatus Binatia bacterium]
MVPLFAGSKEGAESKASTAVAAAPTAGTENVTALLGILVMKGVLAPAEANAIRNAAPQAEFQTLVDVLRQKGVLSAGDMTAAPTSSAPPTPAVQPPAVAIATPASPLLVQAPAQAVAPAPIKPPAPTVASAVTPLRVLPLDAPVREGLVPAFKIGPVKVT